MNALLLVVLALNITFNAPPTVAKFMRSDAFVRAIVGPIGSGKSSGCVVEFLRRAVEQRPNPADNTRYTRWAIIRNTYRQLTDTTRKTFEQWIPGFIGHWVEQDFTFTLRRKLPDGTRVHSEFLFRALDKPSDVGKVLSLELTGAYLNEGREVPKEILDGIQGRVGRYPAKKDGGPTWFGVWMDSNPWAQSHWAYELFNKELPPGFALFEQPDGLSPAAENVENLPDGYYPRLVHGKDQEWVDEYVRARYPKADKGSIYGKWLADLAKRGRLGIEFDHPKDGVFAVFDLGISDATSIWWFRLGKNRLPDVIDWYEASGEGASHYFEVLRTRGYEYSQILLPHDARQRTFQTGVSTRELFDEEFPGLVSIGPELTVADGIGAGRWLLEQDIRIHARCAEGVRRLRSYKYEWDEEKKIYTRKPLHDWTSHTADGWRYLAAFARAAEELTRPPADAEPAPPGTLAITIGNPDDEPEPNRVERIG